jgi:PPOX class probable F420-dependent enzyme
VSDEELWGIVMRGHGGVLATTNADGSPQLSNIYYLSDADRRMIRFSTTTDRVKGQNLLRDPRAALHVSGENFLNFAVASGDASLAVATRPDSLAVEQLFEIHQALGAHPDREGFADEMVAAARMAVTLTVTRLYGQLLDREPRRVSGEIEGHD